MLGLQKIKFFHGGTQYAPGVSGFDFEWAPDGTFRATAAFVEPVRVTIENEALFESVRDTLAAAVRAGLAQLEQDHVSERALKVEICRRQYGSSAELWGRYHDAYLEDAAARALRDAEDQARKENARREDGRLEARRRNIEIYERQNGKVDASAWEACTDDAVAYWAGKALHSAEVEARKEERRRNIEICERHIGGQFPVALCFYSDMQVARYARLAFDAVWKAAHDENARRTREKKIGWCTAFHLFRGRPFFEAMSDETLQHWYSQVGPVVNLPYGRVRFSGS